MEHKVLNLVAPSEIKPSEYEWLTAAAIAEIESLDGLKRTLCFQVGL